MRRPTKNHQLLAAFGFYLLVIALCASVYHLLYSHRRTSFVFASDIAEEQSLSFRSSAKSRIEELRLQAELLGEAIASLMKDGLPAGSASGDFEIRLPSGRRIVFEKEVVFSHGVAGVFRTLTASDPTGVLTDLRLSADWPATQSGYLGGLGALKRNTEIELQRLQKRMATLGSQDPDVWSFWDFLYFSTMTQATVGYGDIVPNSTTVRMVTILQVLLGYGILVVVVNIILGSAEVRGRD